MRGGFGGKRFVRGGVCGGGGVSQKAPDSQPLNDLYAVLLDAGIDKPLTPDQVDAYEVAYTY